MMMMVMVVMMMVMMMIMVMVVMMMVMMMIMVMVVMMVMVMMMRKVMTIVYIHGARSRECVSILTIIATMRRQCKEEQLGKPQKIRMRGQGVPSISDSRACVTTFQL